MCMARLHASCMKQAWRRKGEEGHTGGKQSGRTKNSKICIDKKQKNSGMKESYLLWLNFCEISVQILVIVSFRFFFVLTRWQRNYNNFNGESVRLPFKHHHKWIISGCIIISAISLMVSFKLWPLFLHVVAACPSRPMSQWVFSWVNLMLETAECQISWMADAVNKHSTENDAHLQMWFI